MRFDDFAVCLMVEKMVEEICGGVEGIIVVGFDGEMEIYGKFLKKVLIEKFFNK